MMMTRFTLLSLAALSLSACSMQAPPPPEKAEPPREEAVAPVPQLIEPARPQAVSFLRAEGRRIVDTEGRQVDLRGCNIGGWLLLEPWIAGLDFQKGVETEKELWDILGARFGEAEKLDLIKTYRSSFFNEADVKQIADLGLNCIRIPVWWRAISDPAYGGDVAWLDNCIRWCSQNNVYAIIDLQGAPGGQAKESANVGEPSDGGALWKNEDYKKQTIRLWRDLANRYKDEPAVAAYDLLNEGTAAPTVGDLLGLYDALYKEIRLVDPRHMIVMETVSGFHMLPRPEDMGWTNVVYSFHLYPQWFSDSPRIPAKILPKLQRIALGYNAPTYMGEFNSILPDHGGVGAFLRYREVADYYGWAWTFWTYKAISENSNINWGLQGYYAKRPRPDINSDPLDAIKLAFSQFDSTNSTVHPGMRDALSAPVRWAPDASLPKPAPDAILLSLREAYLLPAEKGSLAIEWDHDLPNVGSWKKGDRIAWKVAVTSDGVYEVGLRMANDMDGNVAQIWIDGLRAATAQLPNTHGWQEFQDHPIGNFMLADGRHVIEVGQADDHGQFINLQYAWITPSANEATACAEDEIRLTPVNMVPFTPDNAIRVEWMNDPPNFGNWTRGQAILWPISLRQGGKYEVELVYSTPNPDTTFRMAMDGQSVLSKPLEATGEWHKYWTRRIGAIRLPAGDHSLAVGWDVPHAGAVGNLRAIHFIRLP